MTVLGAVSYDPAAAVTKATSSLLAMTALDTTNLRLAITVPSTGRVWVQLIGTIHGATTFPQVLLGVLEGSTIRGRVAPQGVMNGTALATTFQNLAAWYPVTGLTPGAATWDAAYAVQTVVAATGIKYGGPNNTTGNNAFGAFVFAVHDLG